MKKCVCPKCNKIITIEDNKLCYSTTCECGVMMMHLDKDMKEILDD